MSEKEEVVLSRLTWLRTGAIVKVTICRPDVRNAIDRETMSAFETIVTRLERIEDVRGVILTGAGAHAFCAGGDLRDLLNLTTAGDGAAMSGRMHALLHRYECLPQLTVSVLNGYAIGGGAELALASDYVVCEAHGFFAFKQAKMGLITGWGGARRLLDRVGYSTALDLVTTGRRITAEQAHTIGLATHIAPAGGGLAVAQGILDGSDGVSLNALRAVKTLFRRSGATDAQRRDALEAEMFAQVWGSPEHRAAVQRFLTDDVSKPVAE
ncbi:MAG: enoyl-CoA hydratase/isomerase family protein [Myxococcota bacterium]|nr:enoyl-CoA hydratase/isomerase family protein [Myxococcota bacterium]